MKAYFSLVALVITLTVNAQKSNIYQNIKGTVYDSESKKGLAGVTVVIMPGSNTILTDEY